MIKIINCQIHDPRKFCFSKNDREEVTVLMCHHSENCETYKTGNCLMKVLGAWTMPLRCPYGNCSKQTGYTIQAQKCGKLVDDAYSRYAKYLNLLHDDVREFCRIGDYIYIKLPHLKNYVNPILDERNSATEFLVHQSSFTPEFIVKLIHYEPISLVGGVIDCYQKEDMPKFIRSLRVNWPEMYAKVKAIYPDVDKIC